MSEPNAYEQAAIDYHTKFGHYPFGPGFDHLPEEEMTRRMRDAVATGKPMEEDTEEGTQT